MFFEVLWWWLCAEWKFKGWNLPFDNVKNSCRSYEGLERLKIHKIFLHNGWLWWIFLVSPTQAEIWDCCGSIKLDSAVQIYLEYCMSMTKMTVMKMTKITILGMPDGSVVWWGKPVKTQGHSGQNIGARWSKTQGKPVKGKCLMAGLIPVSASVNCGMEGVQQIFYLSLCQNQCFASQSGSFV